MIDNNILWSRTLGFDGRIVKEPTFLGAALIGIGFVVGVFAIVFLCLFV